MRLLLIRLFSFILIFTIIFSVPAFAHDRPKHDEDLEQLLFIKEYNINRQPKQIKDSFDALTSAIYLAIDQFNNYGEKDLKILSDFGIRGIISDISEIDYSASSKTHRQYTHRGWDYIYSIDAGHWRKRKKILTQTVNTIFDFDEASAANRKSNSFCALLYYTHILGDRIADESYYGAAQIMDVGGRTDKYDIIDELLNHLDILFAEQKHKVNYLLLTQKLNSLNRKLKKLDPSGIGISSDTYPEYKEYAIKLMAVLKKYVPKLLEKEDFFISAFYSVDLATAS